MSYRIVEYARTVDAPADNTHRLVSGRSDAVQLGLQAASVFLRLGQLALQSFTDLQQLNQLGLGLGQLAA